METLVIDIGNTLLSWRYRDGSGDLRFGTASHQAISDALCDLPVADAIAISSVRAAHEGELKTWLERCGYSDPVWVRSGADVSSTVLTDEPEKTGADRALNALAAHEKYDGDLIVIDFGTATTFDMVDFNGAYKGGIISPGINLSLDALVGNTAKLPRIAIEKPASKSVIGRNTEDQMLIGVFWGYVSLIEGLIDRMKREIGRPATVVATGGLAILFDEHTNLFDAVDSDLTLDGLAILAERASP